MCPLEVGSRSHVSPVVAGTPVVGKRGGACPDSLVFPEIVLSLGVVGKDFIPCKLIGNPAGLLSFLVVAQRIAQVFYYLLAFHRSGKFQPFYFSSRGRELHLAFTRSDETQCEEDQHKKNDQYDQPSCDMSFFLCFLSHCNFLSRS